MQAVKSDDEIKVYDAYLHKESIKEIEGRYYDSVDKAWCVSMCEKNLSLLSMLGAELDDELTEFMRRGVIAAASVVEEPIEPMPIKIKPYNHQVKGFNFCMKNDGFGLLYDVGLGKSLTAVAAAGARFQRGEVKKLLVICPLAVMPVWEREFENVTVPSVVCLLDGTMTQRLDTLRHFPNNETLSVAVINYEGARIMAEQLLKWKRICL